MPSLAVAKTYRVDGGDWMSTDASAPHLVFETQVVDFRFVVVNDGTIALEDVTVVDDVFTAATTSNPDCSAATLEPGASLECTITGVSLPLGAHTNVATASGTVDGVTVSVTDSAHLENLSGLPPA